ncbi:Protein HIRA [Bagarius yarrelli]|uniref:Protein HIRA n=1 Tax=Bagarius yarrelli TaxID=175774 RepID=A0A556VXA6_BAGYA|nr:Protein HIRA [Bagarius yarrelli]
MKLLKPSWVAHNGEDSGKVVIWNMAPVLREEDEKNENVPNVDNTIVIWNARKFPGKYVASQADDRSLKVWRTIDWQLEANITKPFTECGGTTHVLRLSWSPDGQYLVSAHAMNNSGPTAQIIERDGWKTNMDFVGHRKAVTVVLTSLKRPLVVIHDLFDKSIMDITWDFSPALFNSVPILPGSSVTQLSSDSNASLSLRVSHDAAAPPQTKPAQETTAAAVSQCRNTSDNKDGLPKSPLLLTAASKMEPMKALDSRFTERSKVTPGLNSLPAAVNTAPVDRDWKGREESSSDSEEKVVQKSTPPLTKRRSDMDGEVVEKRKKGRPRKDSKLMLSVPQVYTQQDCLVQCADFSSCVTSHDSLGCTGPLSTTQGRNLSVGRLASRLSSTPHHVQQVMTLSFLENQLSSSFILHSANEYRHWLLIYTRFLVNEGKNGLKQVAGGLGCVCLGKVGLKKRDLLMDVCPWWGRNLRFQRLFTEYQGPTGVLRLK